MWKAINVIEPRVVVCETHNAVPIGRAVTVPYDPKFVCDSENYRGASLEAMCRLGRRRGTGLSVTHRFGFNAFFVKNGVGEEFFPGGFATSCVSERSLQRNGVATGPRLPRCPGTRWNRKCGVLSYVFDPNAAD